MTDKKLQVSADGSLVDYYTADVASAQDYYPFGMLQPGRSYNAGGYRYGFNGKENDNDVKGDGNQQDYGMRIYDPRIGKFLSVDPLTIQYPNYTPYSFAGNKPISCVDRDGEEEGLDLTMRRLEEGYLSNKISEDQYRNQIRAIGVNGIVGAAVTADYYFTKGQVSQFLLFYVPLAGAFEHNRAKTPQARIEQDQRSKNAIANAALGYGGEVILGKVSKVITNIGSTIKKAVSETIESIEEKAPSVVNTVAEAPPLSKRQRRRNLAKDFFAAAGKSSDDITSLMTTINFDRAVETVTLKEDTFVWRFEKFNAKSGDEKHFFTDGLGADMEATGMGFEDASGYNLVRYKIEKGTKVLKTSIKETGATQYFSTELQHNIKPAPETN